MVTATLRKNLGHPHVFLCPFKLMLWISSVSFHLVEITFIKNKVLLFNASQKKPKKVGKILKNNLYGIVNKRYNNLIYRSFLILWLPSISLIFLHVFKFRRIPTRECFRVSLNAIPKKSQVISNLWVHKMR